MTLLGEEKGKGDEKPKPSPSFLSRQREGGVGLHPTDFIEAENQLIVERLSRSHRSLKDLVEQAARQDPEAFTAARAAAEVAQPTTGFAKWSVEPVASLAAEFGTDLNTGLLTAQVEALRRKYGENVLSKEEKEPTWKIFLMQFTSPVVILLLIAAVVSLGFQEWTEGVVILLIVLLNAMLATYMEKSAGDALAKLASLAAPKCRVLRNAEESVVEAVDLVPGDVVVLNTGDAIPADIRMFEVTELMANEAILTGESEDVKKTLIAKDITTPFATNMAFGSTIITNGSGRGIVIGTGMSTQVGRIADQLRDAGKETKLTPLQRGLNRLGGLIGVIAICVLIVIVIIAILTKYRDPAHPDADPVLTIVLVAVSFAVSSIPEGLPMVVTICLSLGCRDMVKRKAQVRKLPAVETLGSCTVICSDKTGTLTEGKMTAVKLVTFARNGALSSSDQFTKSFSFYPTKGFNPNGGILGLYLSTGAFLRADLDNQCLRFKGDSFAEYQYGCDAFDKKCYAFYCQNSEYRVQGAYSGWVTNVDYFDPSLGHMVQHLGAVEGKTDGWLTAAELELDFAGLCDTNEQGWCVTAAPKNHYSVVARGSRQGRTMSFLAAVFCESLRAYTVRSWTWWFVVFNRNTWMHFAVGLSTFLTFGVTICPWIKDIFGCVTLMWWHYLFSVGWGVLNLVLDELIPKPIYRRVLGRRLRKHRDREEAKERLKYEM
eukprot:Selendium_serpulae@DN6362_c0_g1_i1.p1